MAVTISIPSKSTGGSLNLTSLRFIPDGTKAAVNVTATWPNFSFTLSAPVGGFPAGVYNFTGGFTGCSEFAIACGKVSWPTLEGIDPGDPPPDWEATAGPVYDEEDTE